MIDKVRNRLQFKDGDFRSLKDEGVTLSLLCLPNHFTESTVEEAALEIFESIGYTILHGPTIAPGEMFAERTDYSDVVLVERLRKALIRINSEIPIEAIKEAIRKVLHPDGPSLIENNRRFHRFLTEGINVEYQGEGRIVRSRSAWLILTSLKETIGSQQTNLRLSRTGVTAGPISSSS